MGTLWARFVRWLAVLLPGLGLSVPGAVRASAVHAMSPAYVNDVLGSPPDRWLSDEQAAAVASSALETLVVAGAGSGKTTLLINRARFLVATGRASGDDILMLAYNRDAARELEQRAQAAGVAARATTFHALGNSLIKEPGERTGVAFGNPGETQSLLERVLTDGLGEDARARLALYFARDLVPRRSISEFATLAAYVAYVRTAIPVTLQGEHVKSHGEWLIANHLYRLGVAYEYESTYDAGQSAKDRHSPDFTVRRDDGTPIYIEYFGIDRRGGTAPAVDPEKYAADMRWKVETHARNGTTLVSLHYYDLQEDRLLDLLDAALHQHGVAGVPRSDQELLQRANEVMYTRRFISLCEQFLGHVRSQQVDLAGLRHRAGNNRRHLAFLEVFAPMLLAYEDALNALKLPDFAGLITEATDRLRTGRADLPIRHLLVDEFQDISVDRSRLVEAIREQTSPCEVMFVGDDWQSIYEFSGSDIALMRAAARPRRNRVRIDMGNSYRLPTVVAEVSRDFVLRNPDQLSKAVHSLSPTRDSGAVVVHWDGQPSTPEANLQSVISRIGAAAQDPSMTLRVLARYRDHLPTASMLQGLWAGSVSTSTVHAAKGLEADYVVVVDVMADTRGFPSTIQDDDVLRLVLPTREKFPHAEERRLFYVALTRARREVHIIAPQSVASPFAFELRADPRVRHHGLDAQINAGCPVCDSGTLLVSKRTGAQYCSNLPLCDFIPPRCPECEGPMRLMPSTPGRYACPAHPETRLPECPKCDWGVIVQRRYFNKRLNAYDKFSSCHAWISTRCDGGALSARAAVEDPAARAEQMRRVQQLMKRQK